MYFCIIILPRIGDYFNSQIYEKYPIEGLKKRMMRKIFSIKIGQNVYSVLLIAKTNIIHEKNFRSV